MKCNMGREGCCKRSEFHDTCQIVPIAGGMGVLVPADIPPQVAVKHDTGKYDPTMLSVELIELVSRVREFGAKKYSRNNWKKGFKITRSLAAALRHIFAYMNGEDNDPESGLSHLGHAVCCLEHAIYDSIKHPENDDRSKNGG